MQKISELHPVALWEYFDQILSIPRPSGKEGLIIEFLEQFARRHHLSHKKDQVGNLLISKPARKEMEGRKGVILQSHLDMVGEKNTGVVHDFEKDPIEAYVEEGWVKARATTLGADDSIGIAASLAILASDSIRHGPLECLFTVDEESGMTGALGLQPGFMKGSVLLNLDSEDEGEIFIGCAGGIDSVGSFSLNLKRSARNRSALRIRVNGLKGGHSGDEIHKGLGNAIKIINRFLWNADRRFRIRIASLEGGRARNAIPREAEAVITVHTADLELIRVYLESFQAIIKQELKAVEPDFKMNMEQESLPEQVMGKKSHRAILNALYACPHGMITMSPEIPGLVETSTNLAAVKMVGRDVLEVITSQRSSVESAKQDIADRLQALFSMAGAKVRHSQGYPGWKPDLSSEVLKISEKLYNRLFSTPARVKAIHAGLECGLFLQKYPDLDMISFGPTIRGAHTPEERLNIESVERFWRFLIAMLEEIPADGQKGTR